MNDSQIYENLDEKRYPYYFICYNHELIILQQRLTWFVLSAHNISNNTILGSNAYNNTTTQIMPKDSCQYRNLFWKRDL